jgi:hypothetical protein
MKDSFETKYNNLFLKVYSNLKALEAGVMNQEQFVELIKETIYKTK